MSNSIVTIKELCSDEHVAQFYAAVIDANRIGYNELPELTKQFVASVRHGIFASENNAMPFYCSRFVLAVLCGVDENGDDVMDVYNVGQRKYIVSCFNDLLTANHCASLRYWE